MSRDDDDLVARFLRLDASAEEEMHQCLELVTAKLALTLYLQCRAASNARAVEPNDLAAAARTKVFGDRSRVFRSFRSANGGLSQWLHRVARNAMIDVLRKNWLPWSDEEPVDPAPVDPASNVLRVIDAERAIAQVVAELGRVGRMVFPLMFEQNSDDAEIASALGMRIANVQLWRHRILATAEQVGIRLGLRNPEPRSERPRPPRSAARGTHQAPDGDDDEPHN